MLSGKSVKVCKRKEGKPQWWYVSTVICEFIMMSCREWNNVRAVATANCLCGHSRIIFVSLLGKWTPKQHSPGRISSSPRQHMHDFLYILRLILWKDCTLFGTHYVCTLLCHRPTYTIMILSNLSVSNTPLQWRHHERDGISNHQRVDCLPSRLFRRRSKKRASNEGNVSIWWRHLVDWLSPATMLAHSCWGISFSTIIILCNIKCERVSWI